MFSGRRLNVSPVSGIRKQQNSRKQQNFIKNIITQVFDNGSHNLYIGVNYGDVMQQEEKRPIVDFMH